MKTQLLGVCVSLSVHAIAAFLLFHISQGFSPGPGTLALDLSFEAAGPMGGAGPREEALSSRETPAPGGPPRAAEAIPSAPADNSSGPVDPAPPPAAPEPRQAEKQPPVQQDPPPEPQVLAQAKPEPEPQPAPPAPDPAEPLDAEKTPADPTEQKASPPRQPQEMATPPEPVAAETAGRQANPLGARNRSQGDSPAGPSEDDNFPPASMAAGPGSGGLADGAGYSYPGNPADSGGDAYFDAHFGFIRRRLRETLCYPSIARQRGWSGKVLVAFTVQPDGLADKIEIKKSCGISLLDKSAMATVRKAFPFPKPPRAVRIVIPILYQLN